MEEEGGGNLTNVVRIRFPCTYRSFPTTPMRKAAEKSASSSHKPGKLEVWETLPLPTTQVQRKRFITACVDYIVKPADAESTSSSFPPHLRAPPLSASHTQPDTCIGFGSQEVKLHGVHRCTFCDSEKAIPFAANPFAIQNAISACDSCIRV